MSRHVPPLLRRRPAVREPKRRFTIVCEGRNTEPAYFEALRATLSDALITLVIEPAAGTPMTIARRSVELARQATRARRRGAKVDSFEENDEIWAIFDRDLHPQYAEAVGLCEAKQVGVARSNPCFELWLILHHADFDRPDDHHAVQDHLEKICADYNAAKGKRPDCGRFIHKVEEAERRAERQLARREAEGLSFGPPSTTVFKLTRAIRCAAELARGTSSDKKR
jgi:hypothetical protein